MPPAPLPAGNKIVRHITREIDKLGEELADLRTRPTEMSLLLRDEEYRRAFKELENAKTKIHDACKQLQDDLEKLMRGLKSF